MTTGIDIIVGALRNIKVLGAGETANAQDAADALAVLNDLLDAWDTQHLGVFCVVENILSFNSGQYQYTIGNPVAGMFIGTLVGGSPTISGVPSQPQGLVVGSTLTDVQGSIPAGTTVTAISIPTLTMSANALSTVALPENITYTAPGDFAIARPLRITNAFTRITASGSTGLDYPIDFEGGRDKYTSIGLKGIQAPWPIVAWYNPTYPLGNIYFYPSPSSAGELHLFTDNLFSSFETLTQGVNLPQGYVRALKKNLALELAPEYGKQPSAVLMTQAKESLAAIKALNSSPAVQAIFDRDIVSSQRTDAGWILRGGFN